MDRGRLLRMNVKQGAPDEAVMEAARRMNYDGIPRTVYKNGAIMKWDWECPDTADIDEEGLEDHVRRLLDDS